MTLGKGPWKSIQYGKPLRSDAWMNMNPQFILSVEYTPFSYKHIKFYLSMSGTEIAWNLPFVLCDWWKKFSTCSSRFSPIPCACPWSVHFTSTTTSWPDSSDARRRTESTPLCSKVWQCRLSEDSYRKWCANRLHGLHGKNSDPSGSWNRWESSGILFSEFWRAGAILVPRVIFHLSLLIGHFTGC